MLSRQPTELDYADPSKFRFTVNKLPKVEFFTTQALLPGVNLGDVVIPSPFKEIPVQGTQLTFDNLEIQFLVDEKLENYIELHQWLVGIGFPQSREQFSSFRKNNAGVFPSSGRTPNAGGLFGDATLTVTSSKNNPTVEIRFSDIYPVALSSLEFNQQATDVEYLTANCTFSYTLYEIFTL
tara:strand:- start:180 stop:722 length:543 start_codon:yes stop_codon:yes gene_type:complete